jgi:hypothetical protein
MPLALQAIRPQKFQQLNPTRTAYNLRRSMRRYLQGIAKEMQKYPPQANPNGYHRTYKLHDGWAEAIIHIAPDGSYGELINPVKWAVYAQGPYGGGRGKGERQTRLMRLLGWVSITDVTRKNAKRFQEIMNRAIQGSPGF